MIIKCKMCGGDIEFTPGATYGTCEYCGSTSTIPKADDEGRLNLFNRANSFRRKCEFDKAVAAYEKILEQDDTDAEAHWGAVISRFGIEYVEDPATGKRIPTCHRVQLTSILADEDYKAAVEHAPDAESRCLYEEEAARIAEIQRGILAISQNEKPYDVFICYKETDENGQRTHDSQWAQEVYYGLTEQGYKVFFSRITLEDKLGQEYEPYIFAALNSARVMIVIGSKPEYFNAVWVKNEWSRYLALMARDRKRLLIPCYRGMDPYDLPDELSSLQSQDMSKIGFMQDLLRGVKKVLDAEKKPVQAAPVQQVVQTVAPGVTSLMKRIALFLEDGDFKQASEYVDRVLDINPEYAPAYVAKVCVALSLRKEADLAETTFRYDDNPDWQKALRFATPQEKAVYEGYMRKVMLRVRQQIRDYAYDCAIEMAVVPGASWYKLNAELERYKESCTHYTGNRSNGKRRPNSKTNEAAFIQAVKTNDPGNVSEKDLKTAAEMFDAIFDRDASERSRQCMILAEQARQKAVYRDTVAIRETLLTPSGLERAAQVFLSIPDYKDAKAQAKACTDAAEAIRARLYDSAVKAMNEAGNESGKWSMAIKSLSESELTGYRDVDQLREKAAMRYQECVSSEEKAKRQEEERRRQEEERRRQEEERKRREIEAAKRQAEERRRREAEAAAAKKKRNAIIGILAAVVVVAAVLVVTLVIIPGNITETKYLKAKSLAAKGDYAGAAAMFSGIRGYKDVDSLLTNDHNLAAARDAKYSVGNYVTFGHYPQTREGNDSTEIEWLVLARDGNKVLLISRYGLDTKPYNDYWADITWEKCTLRTWLNGTFLSKAFTAEEQKGILLTNVDNGSSQGYSKWSTNGGNNTQDRVFLLSYAEANKYFGVTYSMNTKSRVAPTAYAIEQGAYTSNSDKTADGTAAGWWWLRSPGYYPSSAARVYDGGSLGYSSFSNDDAVVRPALWINLESGIF